MVESEFRYTTIYDVAPCQFSQRKLIWPIDIRGPPFAATNHQPVCSMATYIHSTGSLLTNKVRVPEMTGVKNSLIEQRVMTSLVSSALVPRHHTFNTRCKCVDQKRLDLGQGNARRQGKARQRCPTFGSVDIEKQDVRSKVGNTYHSSQC